MKTFSIIICLLISGCGIDKREYPISCPEKEWLVGPPGTEFAFCITAERQVALTSTQANGFCASLGKNVCTSDQWSRACIEHRSDMIFGGYEWISGGEFPGIAHADPYPVDNPTCTRNEHGVFQGVFPFRCCS